MLGGSTVLYLETPRKCVTVVNRLRDGGPGGREKYFFTSDEAISKFCNDRNGSGLVPINQPVLAPEEPGYGTLLVVHRREELQEGGVYTVFPKPSSLDAPINIYQFIDNESRIQEQESLAALVEHLVPDVCSDLVTKPQIIRGKAPSSQREQTQEWDGVVYSKANDTLYLLEAKHNLSLAELEEIENRSKVFKQILANPAIVEYKGLDGCKIQVVVSGLLFAKEVMELAIKKNFFVAYPSGARYAISETIANRFISSS
jgi:hypothetical protein